MNASDIMVKSADMNILSDTMTLNEALIAAHMHHHTRFPLVKNGNVNAIVGYVNFKDIVGALRLNPSDPTLNGIKRPLEIVTDTTPLSELLRKFTRGYQHIGVVKNEQGETLGMVTLEDLIEMLVGDLEDEYDKSPELFVQLAENRFRAGGGVTFEQLSVRVCNKLPSWDLTIDEWILGQCAGVIPENYAIVYQNVSFKVRRIARGHVFDVIIERIPD
jgi:CBS domain containing-hemolysin-like protein